MDKVPEPESREDRLAAKLRENLRRRKAQAREQALPSRLREGAGEGESSPPDS
ncbi:MAG: hypothetical protein AB7F98_05360 [Novosphingobium sp.]